MRADINQQYMQCTYNVTQRRVRATTVAVEKAINVTYSECVFEALGIHPALRTRHVVICGLSGCPVFLNIIS